MGPRGAISPPMEEAAPVQLSKLVEHIGEPTLEGEVCLHLEHSETAGVMSQLMFQCLVGEDASASPPIGGVQLLQRNPGHNPHLLGWKVVPGPENKGIKKGHHDKIAHMWAWMPAHATSEILVLQNAWKKSIRNSFKQNHQNSTSHGVHVWELSHEPGDHHLLTPFCSVDFHMVKGVIPVSKIDMVKSIAVRHMRHFKAIINDNPENLHKAQRKSLSTGDAQMKNLAQEDIASICELREWMVAVHNKYFGDKRIFDQGSLLYSCASCPAQVCHTDYNPDLIKDLKVKPLSLWTTLDTDGGAIGVLDPVLGIKHTIHLDKGDMAIIGGLCIHFGVSSVRAAHKFHVYGDVPQLPQDEVQQRWLYTS
ncbi:hypothetical protein AB1Y20_001224 [Prymnesium parvum]|uniref:Uncharacterized protein n=1 Tax=Prymnesium parvum TaxID=97485 RepID=A0AB34K8Y0_PRYPA